MENSIDNKINELSPDKKIIYTKNLQDILEWRDSCTSYGAKDPVNMPSSDVNIVKINLYQEMFESGKYKTH